MDEFVEGLRLEDWIDTLDSNSPEESACERLAKESACERLARDLWQAVKDGNIENVRSLLEQKADPNHEVFRSEEWVKDKYPPLHTACIDVDLEIVKELVNAGANVNASGGRNGSTPLHLACVIGYMELMDYLIRETGCTVDVKDKDNRSPLHLACENGNQDLVEYLVEEANCDVNVKDKDNRSPLHLACENRNQGLVEYLVEEANCDVNVRDDHGQSPLDRVLEDMDDEEDLDFGLYLINHGCDVEGKVKLLCEACYWDRLDVVKELVEQHKVDPKNVRNNTDGVLHRLGFFVHAIFEKLVEQDKVVPTDVKDKYNMSPLHWACMTGKKGVVEYLVEKANCDINVRDDHGRSPLDRALECVSRPDDLDLGLYLINHGCGGDEGKVKLMCEACFWSKLDVVKELVELHKVNPNDVRNDKGQSPLDRAFDDMYEIGRFDLVVYLISHGCGNDKDRAIVLAQACRQVRLDVVKELVEQHKVDPKDASDDEGQSPLDIVWEGMYELGHFDFVVYLISHGCGDDKDRACVLTQAGYLGRLDVVKELVEQHKVDPKDLRDYEGYSPLDRALDDMYEYGHFDFVVYLISHGCGDDKDRAIVLAQACRQGRLDVVKELVEQHKVDPKDAGDDEGQSPLDIALEDMYKNGRFHVAVYLISHDCGDDEERANVLANCEINVRDENYRSPLHLACVRGYKDMVEYLVEKANCDVNVRYEGDRSPLHWACEGGHKDMVEYLVEKANCDVNVRDEGDRSPLHLACEEGHKDVVEYLVEKANCNINVRDGGNWSPLHFACEGRNKDVVEYLVEKANCDVNMRDKSNQTPLHKGCGSWQCSLDVVQYLVETTNCDVNARDGYGRSPLHLACEGGHKYVVKYLVEKANCDVNVKDEGHRSPLHLACLRGHKDVAQYLVEKANCDVNMRDKNNQTPLHKSCGSWQCTLDVVQYLVEKTNCDVNARDDKGRTPLDSAMENNTNAALYLINHRSGMHGDKQRGKLLCRACNFGELDMVKKLVGRHKVDPKDVNDEGNRSPLHLACEGGHYRVVEYLLENADCDINIRDDDDRSPLDLACERGHRYIVQYLVKKANCDVNMRDKKNQTPLHMSCGSWRDTLEVVQYLVENTNCDVNATDDQGSTPLDTAMENNTSAAFYLINRVPGMCGDNKGEKLLCRACNSGELNMVKKLVEEHKVDPKDVRDEDNKSPLYLACEGGHKCVVKYLVEKANCDINVKDKEDRSPLHLACEGGQKDVVEYLVEKANCDVNVRDQDDRSPLHLACEGGHKGVVKYLVEKANCDVNIRDKNNQTPLHKSCGSWCFMLDMVQCLVETTNCDINVSDDKGKTPLDLATERSTDTALNKHVRKKWTKVVDYLKSLPGAQSVGGGQKRVNTENHESSPPPSKRPRTQSDVIDDGDMTSLDLAVDTCLDQDQREESLPAEHSAGQKRVSSGDHESRPPPSKRPRTQNDSTTPPPRTCPVCKRLCDIHYKKCPNPQCGQKLPPIRSCPECNRSCHVRCKKCPHPECGHTFPPTSKSKATGEAKKNPASLLQILQKKVEQLGQNGYNVAVMVHKPNPERDTFNKYSTEGPARDYIDSPDVFNNWKEHFKKSSRAAGTSSGGADTAGTSSGGSDTAGTSGGGSDTAGTSSGGAGGGVDGTSSASGRVSLSSDQMSAIVQEVLKQMQKKT